MYLLIRYPGEIIVEGVVLARGVNQLRVVAAAFPDTIELKRTGTAWFAADGVQVEFDFLMSDKYQTERAPAVSASAVMTAGVQ